MMPLSFVLVKNSNGWIIVCTYKTSIQLWSPLIYSCRAERHVIFWRRYIEDILAYFKGLSRQLNNFLKYINSIFPKIIFTLENNYKINLLDLRYDRTDNKTD